MVWYMGIVWGLGISCVCFITFPFCLWWKKMHPPHVLSSMMFDNRTHPCSLHPQQSIHKTFHYLPKFLCVPLQSISSLQTSNPCSALYQCRLVLFILELQVGGSICCVFHYVLSFLTHHDVFQILPCSYVHQ
jgi:hypothetical protein